MISKFLSLLRRKLPAIAYIHTIKEFIVKNNFFFCKTTANNFRKFNFICKLLLFVAFICLSLTVFTYISLPFLVLVTGVINVQMRLICSSSTEHSTTFSEVSVLSFYNSVIRHARISRISNIILTTLNDRDMSYNIVLA